MWILYQNILVYKLKQFSSCHFADPANGSCFGFALIDLIVVIVCSEAVSFLLESLFLDDKTTSSDHYLMSFWWLYPPLLGWVTNLWWVKSRMAPSWRNSPSSNSCDSGMTWMWKSQEFKLWHGLSTSILVYRLVNKINIYNVISSYPISFIIIYDFHCFSSFFQQVMG